MVQGGDFSEGKTLKSTKENHNTLLSVLDLKVRQVSRSIHRQKEGSTLEIILLLMHEFISKCF